MLVTNTISSFVYVLVLMADMIREDGLGNQCLLLVKTMKRFHHLSVLPSIHLPLLIWLLIKIDLRICRNSFYRADRRERVCISFAAFALHCGDLEVEDQVSLLLQRCNCHILRDFSLMFSTIFPSFLFITPCGLKSFLHSDVFVSCLCLLNVFVVASQLLADFLNR